MTTNTIAKRVNIVTLRLVKESSTLYEGRRIKSPIDCYNLFKRFMDGLDREHFIVAALNTKNEPTSIHTVSIGSLNAAIVHPREVFKSAVISNAASIICAHNHPSGDPSPSNEDIDITKRLAEAGKIIGIDLLDHLVIGDGRYISLKEKGII